MGSISINRLSKQFGAAKVLNDIELEIQDGEFLVLVGPSGCRQVNPDQFDRRFAKAV